MHASKFDHPLSLHMKKYKKINNEESNKQITKVAIGKPGGASFEEEWELS